MHVVVGNRHALGLVCLAGGVEREVPHQAVRHVEHVDVVEVAASAAVKVVTHTFIMLWSKTLHNKGPRFSYGHSLFQTSLHLSLRSECNHVKTLSVEEILDFALIATKPIVGKLESVLQAVYR